MPDSLLARFQPRLDALIHDSRDEMADHLVKLLMFNTVSGSKDPEERRLCGNEISRGFSFLCGLAKRMGFEWRNYDNKVCVIEQPGGNEVLGLPLHLDVVPSGEGWHYPAFGGMVENGVIYGRGAQDDKGPVVQMLHALDAVRRLGLPFRRTVRLIVASQEETGDWSDVEHYLEKESAPDLSIVSDARFPVVNGEKGIMDLRIELRWKTKKTLSHAQEFRHLKGGERSNIVPNRAEITWDAVSTAQARAFSETLKSLLEEFLKANPGADAFPVRMDTDPDTGEHRVHVIFLGKGAHGSAPEQGHNALLDALRYCAGLPELPEGPAAATAFLHGLCENMHGEAFGIAGEHPFIGRTTVNLGIAEVTAHKAEAVVNLRPTLGWTAERILECARSRVLPWAAEHGMEATVDFRAKPHEAIFVDPERFPELIGSLQAAYTGVTGAACDLLAVSGTTYMKIYPNSVCFGPVRLEEEGSRVHQADECIHVDHLERNTRIYAAALLLLAAEAPPA